MAKTSILRTSLDLLFYSGASQALRRVCGGVGAIFMLHHIRPGGGLQNGFAPAVIETVLQELIKEDLLSDHRYAEIYALSRVDKGYGPWRIRRELSEHGVSEEIITGVIRNFENDWMAKLAALHRKRFAALAPDHSVEQAAQIRFLRQRGFTLEQINHLFQSLR